MAKPKNVLLITTDQMRRDHMGCGGNPVIRTPNLDRLAAGGTCLDRAYVSNPVCMPNRSTIATGRLPRNHLCWSNGIRLPEHEKTIADVLNDRGYHTTLLGKAHFQNFGHHPDVPLEQAGMECREGWLKGVLSPDWTGPYYGFQDVRLCIAHSVGNLETAHLKQWVLQRHPEAIDLLAEPHDPSPTGAPQCSTPKVPAAAHSSSWLGEIGPEYLRARARDGQPFFAWVSFPDPHHPFTPPPGYDTMYDPAEVVMPRITAEALADKPPHYRRAHEGGELWEGIGAHEYLNGITEPQMREIIARTYGMISLIDENIGRLLDALDETGLADNTIVIFTSDHGDLMGDCGLVFKGPFLLEGLINVPMIWRVPGASAGVRPAGLMNSVDIAPTVLELLGVDVPGWMDGMPLGELARGGQSARQTAFVEFKSMYRPELNLRAAVTAEAKLIYYAGQDFGELYDLTADRPEARNLYDDPDWANVRRDLQGRILDDAVLSHDERLMPECHA